MIYLFGFLYVLLCSLLGYAARHRRMGGHVGFVLSVVLTPLVMFVILKLTESNFTTGEGRER
jgi:hypothetical protein